MTTQEIAKRYVTLCQQGKFDVCLDELYAKNAESVEAPRRRAVERTAKGWTPSAKGKDWTRSRSFTAPR
jgi:hypothetical protein